MSVRKQDEQQYQLPAPRATWSPSDMQPEEMQVTLDRWRSSEFPSPDNLPLQSTPIFPDMLASFGPMYSIAGFTAGGRSGMLGFRPINAQVGPSGQLSEHRAPNGSIGHHGQPPFSNLASTQSYSPGDSDMIFQDAFSAQTSTLDELPIQTYSTAVRMANDHMVGSPSSRESDEFLALLLDNDHTIPSLPNDLDWSSLVNLSTDHAPPLPVPVNDLTLPHPPASLISESASNATPTNDKPVSTSSPTSSPETFMNDTAVTELHITSYNRLPPLVNTLSAHSTPLGHTSKCSRCGTTTSTRFALNSGGKLVCNACRIFTLMHAKGG
ncbi:hypothetical protein BCR39DRAFT_286180 [Naematelia encephala]|uniref:GATA-type domain-containing protein n=1 Tax=Naematelia encephala TaxID=71784 RepID=A0A1Y2ATC5_9TREE|nr:hypothetical protein BCR39DRAFT_286180 [Naematelia encephala]